MRCIGFPKAVGRHIPFRRQPLLRPFIRPTTLSVVGQQTHTQQGHGRCWPSPTSIEARFIHSSNRCLSETQPSSLPAHVTSPKSPTDHTYLITFTCKRCFNRSSHEMSGQAYHKGTVLITCPGCKNRHVISDHLMIFSEQGRSLEDILKEKGETITKATASSEADLEFLDDGSVKARVPKQLEGLTPMVPGETGWPKGLTEEEVKKVRGDQ